MQTRTRAHFCMRTPPTAASAYMLNTSSKQDAGGGHLSTQTLPIYSSATVSTCRRQHLAYLPMGLQVGVHNVRLGHEQKLAEGGTRQHLLHRLRHQRQGLVVPDPCNSGRGGDSSRRACTTPNQTQAPGGVLNMMRDTGGAAGMLIMQGGWFPSMLAWADLPLASHLAPPIPGPAPRQLYLR